MAADDADDADGWEGLGSEGPAHGREGERGLEGRPAHDAAFDAAFASLLRALRTIPGPCAPPVGAGAFDILYASEREVVVWYQPARDGVEQREVTIPGALLRAAWALTRRGEPVEEAALRALATGAAGGRWLLALLAQVPGIETRREEPVAADGGRGPEGPAHDAMEDEPRVTLIWRGER
ncbi:MAG TPA: hypothetical protein VFQ25_00930 [Ktedonobacterales bacterium]|nr:hypothetical protein [Ktedonobacterales bacterium]